MAREARDKIALGVLTNPRTNNEPRHYYSEVREPPGEDDGLTPGRNYISIQSLNRSYDSPACIPRMYNIYSIYINMPSEIHRHMYIPCKALVTHVSPGWHQNLAEHICTDGIPVPTSTGT